MHVLQFSQEKALHLSLRLSWRVPTRQWVTSA